MLRMRRCLVPLASFGVTAMLVAQMTACEVDPETGELTFSLPESGAIALPPSDGSPSTMPSLDADARDANTGTSPDGSLEAATTDASADAGPQTDATKIEASVIFDAAGVDVFVRDADVVKF